MTNVGGRHQYLGGAIQEHDEHAILMSILLFIILIIREDKFSLCECACLEKKIFKGLHQIFYVQIVFGYYFANNIGGATIWTNIIWSTICWWFQRRRGKYEYFRF